MTRQRRRRKDRPDGGALEAVARRRRRFYDQAVKAAIANDLHRCVPILVKLRDYHVAKCPHLAAVRRSHEWLAAETNRSVRTIERNVAALVAAGITLAYVAPAYKRPDGKYRRLSVSGYALAVSRLWEMFKAGRERQEQARQARAEGLAAVESPNPTFLSGVSPLRGGSDPEAAPSSAPPPLSGSPPTPVDVLAGEKPAPNPAPVALPDGVAPREWVPDPFDGPSAEGAAVIARIRAGLFRP